MSYYRSRVEDISAEDVRQIFDDLCRMVRWPIGDQYTLRSHDWLVFLFQHFKGSEGTAKHLGWESPLTQKIGKLTGTEAHAFCGELCHARGEGLELHETGTVLSLIKKLYASPNGRLGKVRKRLL